MKRDSGRRPANRSSPGAAPHGLPQPSIWPVTVALGLTLLLGGIPTNVLVALGGAVLFALGLWGWVRDLLTSPGAAPAPGVGERLAGQPGSEERLAQARGREARPPDGEQGEETR